ncbi:MAG TPA: hydroxymethylglutaryl-CoA lyase [Chitinophagaceae bacterium]|nr:hydroxymethylglutaryl-CoA lyase [Chitinophagaceae bacterium]
MQNIKLIECPRDAMQGWERFIPTELKIEYINKLLEVGFDTIDFGSFVSAKAIPQLADTKQVLNALDLTSSKSKLLAIIANLRGAEEAVQYSEITYLGFPFSISETFQKLNTNSTIQESLQTIEQIQNLCVEHQKKLVTYISMGFGNPYGDDYSSEIAIHWVNELSKLGISIFSMSDTVGVSNPSNINTIFTHLVNAFPSLEFGAHFHSTKETSFEKIEAAYSSNCFRFDSALNGIGGCPMAQNELVGNLATEDVLQFFKEKNIDLQLNMVALKEALVLAKKVFI